MTYQLEARKGRGKWHSLGMPERTRAACVRLMKEIEKHERSRG